ncbi:sugar ABC transporter substrate-binding protein [Desulfofundulus thermosubterraneus]|uniref:ABC-type sugar transport system, substrate-binding protein, contains N-terminal xre family HTH domain n=1 Tax=Desulfofundulus thermosubterraneus DSM 16057 TaxID=1121432 RepID=A0A1M6C2U2_9FIRM|nr:substrate-binding domain-containing protein [Desulfofundulus thermosubterraneus]SHI55337.1 ABC-type sugar transport system, substrate-binding protein, contains N-terminal xre family HTH domain [Desulfofundulus thermosubterraneus DSM 16057]
MVRCAGWKKAGLPIFLAVLLILTGCPGRGEQEQQMTPQLRIAVSLADMQRDGNQIIKQVMNRRRREEKMDITWLDAKNDPAQQEKQLQQLAGRRVKAVVLQAVDPASAPRLVQQLVQNNIKVVALETLPANTPVDAYVASDHARAGELQVQFINEALRQAAGMPAGPGASSGGQGGQTGGQGQGDQAGGGQGQGTAQMTMPGRQLPSRRPLNVMILAGDPRDNAAREIVFAARKALEANPQVRVVEEAQQPGNQPAMASLAVQQALARFNNKIDVILASDSRLATAAVEVLKAAGLNNRVLTVGVGADREASRALRAGEHDAEVDTRPDLLGQYALDAAVGLAKTGYWQYDTRVISGDYSIPARIVPVRLIQSANAYLLQERWGKEMEQKQGGGQGQGEGQAGGSDQGSSSSNQSGQQGGEGKQKPRTTLRITTREGKTVEVQIQGEVERIESVEGGGAQQMPVPAGGAGGGGVPGGGGAGGGGGT